MIKNLVFDFGGVLLTDDDAGVLFDNPEVKEKFRVEDIVLQNAWSKYWREVGENRITIFEFYNNFQKEISGEVDEKLSKDLFEIYKNRTHSLEPYVLLPSLKKKYNLYALTNIFKEGYEFKKKKYHLNDLFDEIIASCEVKFSKADPKIFQILLDRTKIVPEESLFVDDREKNTIQAEKMNFKVILYKNFSDFKEKLNSFDISYE